MKKLLQEGIQRGRDAGWIFGADWEALLLLPLDEVRRRYAISEPVPYEEARALGTLTPVDVPVAAQHSA